jgi:alkanesulfonate monooxygenase
MTVDVYWRLPMHGCKGEFGIGRANRGDWSDPTAGNLAPGYGVDGTRDEYGFADHLGDIARAAEISGFYGGLLPSFPMTDDPWTIAPALARETKTFRFMIAFQPGFVNPVHAARLSASLQRASNGRLVYNIITGGGGPSQLWWGDRVAHDDRYARTSEFLDVLKGSWAGSFTYKGRFYQVENGGLQAPLSEQPLPEIYFSGSSEAAIAAAGRHADYYLSHLEPLESLKPKLDRVRERTAKEGREARFSLRFDVLARPTPEEAWAEVARGWDTLSPAALARLNQTSGDSVGFQRQRAFRPTTVAHYNDLHVDAHIGPALWGGFHLFRGGPPIGVVGSYEQAAEWLDRYLAAGIDSFILAGTPHLEEAYRVGEEVLPLVRGRVSDQVTNGAPESRAVAS